MQTHHGQRTDLGVIGDVVAGQVAVREANTRGGLDVDNVGNSGPGVIVVVELVCVGGVDVEGAVLIQVSLKRRASAQGESATTQHTKQGSREPGAAVEPGNHGCSTGVGLHMIDMRRRAMTE